MGRIRFNAKMHVATMHVTHWIVFLHQHIATMLLRFFCLSNVSLDIRYKVGRKISRKCNDYRIVIVKIHFPFHWNLS